jgi:mannose-6-phosphate isomerase
MGIHPEGPSEISPGGVSLAALIAGDPRRCLGAETAENFGTLPFLFKLLAAEKPLSIQAHPNKKQAEEGWARENARKIPPGDPARNYRDRNHKPEILAAIDPCTALCGFREKAAILRGLAIFFSTLPPAEAALRGEFAGLMKNLERAGPSGGLRGFLGALFSLSPEARRALSRRALESPRLAEKHPEYRGEWELCAALAAAYPGDPAVIAPLYLNLLNLEPGEAIFLPAGVLHAYVRGFGVELMANSDNVLRGGLTAKHVDSGELLSILDFSPFRPEIFRPPPSAPALYRFPAECREFSLALLRGRGEETVFPAGGPLILVLIQGEALVSGEGAGGEETLRLGPGESLFAAAAGPGAGNIRLRGNYTLYAASVGTAGTESP